MTTIPQRRFGDPLEVLLREEAITCKGCRYHGVGRASMADPTPIARCNNPRILQLLADARCDQYEEAKP